MVQYLSLEEAARILGISHDKLKEMAERNEVRAFRDRGTMQFRSQEIEELARRLGRGSDPELPIRDPAAPKTPQPTARKAPTQVVKTNPEVFDFALGGDDSEQVALGQDPKSGISKSGKSPRPAKPGSDSDVRLVADGSDLDFQVAEDSKVRVVDDEHKAPGSGKKKGKGDQGDSAVRMVHPEAQSDSDVKIVPQPGPDDSSVIIAGQGGKKASDSDIRLEPEKGSKPATHRPGSSDESLVTEEIDLDAELKQGESSLHGRGSKSKSKGKKTEAHPTEPHSPFELSDPKMKKKSPSGMSLDKDSSSDFELTPGQGKDQSPLELSDEEVGLGEIKGGPGDSGINLQDPADSGISLEQSGSGDVLDFEVSDDSGPATPKPKRPTKETEESSSEFELSLDADHPGAKGEPDSDSEFELTLDDSGDLLPIDEPGAASGKGKGEADIFETDFEVPALDDDSGSQAVALDESDTDVESSDFDLALGEEDIGADEESGSQVVALEEEEAEAGASTVSRPSRRRANLLDEEELDEEGGGVGLAEEEEAAARVAAAPAHWGPLPAILMIPSVLVMFLVTLISFEQIHSMWGYHHHTKVSGTLSRALAEMFFDVPKD